MAQSLPEYLDLIKRTKPEEIVTISREMDPAYELTALVVKLEREARRRPVLIAERMRGTKFPVLTNLHASRSRLALAMGAAPSDMLTTYLRAMDKPIPPKIVKTGPCKDVILTGERVNLYDLPQILHHEGDAGAYITAAISFAKDPTRENWNCAYNRLMIKGRDTTSIHLTLGKHLWEFQRIAESLGAPLPVGFAIGVHPAIALGALAIGSIDEDERAIMGALLREPLELVRCETSDVLVPAHAEIIIEAEIQPGARTPEGPFGEFTGYSLGEREREVVKVKAITHRTGAYFQDITVAHLDHMLLSTIPMEANLYRAVRAMVPSVKAVRVPGPFTCYVSLEQRLPGQAKNAILSVLGADMYMKRVVVVDHDVDIFDDRQVTWAIATRCQPDRDLTIITHARGSDLDPSTAQDGYSAKWGVDATAKPSLAGFTPRHRVPPETWQRINLKDFGLGDLGPKDPPEGVTRNFAARLDAVALRRPEAPALVWEDGALTWRALERRAGGVAQQLSRRGITVGDTIALIVGNGWGFAAALWGGLKLGVTIAPLNPLLSASERGRVLDHLRPAAVLEDVPPDEAEWPSAEAVAPALVLYTSGSTGQPKGAVLSHAALRAANESWAGPVMRLTPDDVVLAALPLAHSFGLNGALLAPLLAGATVALQERFVAEETLATLSRHRVTVLPAVATMFQKMLEVPALSAAACATLRLSLSGAAPCSWELAEAWRQRTGVRLLRGFGMTELFRPISYLADEAADFPDAIGRAVPDVELRVMDEAGEACRADAVGELWIRSPAAMDGYLRAEQETHAVLRDGWFRTGDLAKISAAGFVTIVGRKKELILRGGYSVVPGEVEAALLAHRAVAEAAVVGIPDAALGEEVAAFVTLRPGAQVGGDELVAFCRGQLAAFKYPRHVSIVRELPKSATGKVLKWQLTSREGAGL